MILGNAGIVTVIVTATSSLVTSKGYQLCLNVLILAGSIFVIYKIVTHKGFMRRWESFIEDKFAKYRVFDEAVTEDLLHLIEGYSLVWLMAAENSPLNGVSVTEHKNQPTKEYWVWILVLLKICLEKES